MLGRLSIGRPVAGAVMLLSLLWSCNPVDDFKDLSLGVNTSLPVGGIDFSQASLFELSGVDTNIVRYDPEGVMVIVDSIGLDLMNEGQFDEVLSFDFPKVRLDTDDFIPDISRLSGLDAGIEIPEKRVVEKLDMPGDERLSKVKLSAGSLRFSDGGALSGLVCKVENVFDVSGNPIEIRAGQVVDLAGCTIKPSDGNSMAFVFSGTVYPSASLGVELSFDNVKIFSARGYFGRKEITPAMTTITIDESINDFLGNVDSIYLADPSITINFKNTFVLPVAVILTSLKADGRDILLDDGYGKTRFYVGEGVSSIVIDNSITANGTGISDMLTKDLRTVEFLFSIITNPSYEDLMVSQGTLPEVQENYYDRTCAIDGSLVLAMPLYGVFDNISYSDTYDMDLDLGLDFKKAQLAITGSNYFPLQLTLDLVGVTVQGQEKPFAMDRIVIPSTENNLPMSMATPVVIDQSNYILVELNPEVLNDIANIDKMRFKISASSLDASNRRNVKIYKDSRLKLNLAIGINGVINN
ncbi:MAG: hypothetical protein K2N21_06015 [Rikenellaceae bacterium]|nr:hypothetical protein [Rikenellaceae bacterium]